MSNSSTAYRSAISISGKSFCISLLILFPSSLQLWEVMEKNILWFNLHHTHDFFYFRGTHFLPMKLGGH